MKTYKNNQLFYSRQIFIICLVHVIIIILKCILFQYSCICEFVTTYKYFEFDYIYNFVYTIVKYKKINT